MNKQTTAGFTLIEILAVTIMVGILAAIGAPSWVGFVNRQQLNTANNQIYQAMRQAQSRASQQREAWQVSIRQQGDRVQWAVYKSPANPNVLPSSIRWEQSAKSIQIDAARTTLLSTGAGGFYRMIFNYKGCPVRLSSETCTQSSLSFNPTPPRLNLSNTNGSFNQGCVIVRTRLGAIATGSDNDCN